MDALRDKKHAHLTEGQERLLLFNLLEYTRVRQPTFLLRKYCSGYGRLFPILFCKANLPGVYWFSEGWGSLLL